MDFRGMLKKKKYAKWDNDEGPPEWGDLKHLEEEQQAALKTPAKVRQADKRYARPEQTIL